MSNSKSTDHWNVLARLLGTARQTQRYRKRQRRRGTGQAPGNWEKAEMPETPLSADLFWEQPSAELASEPGPTTEIAAVVRACPGRGQRT